MKRRIPGLFVAIAALALAGCFGSGDHGEEAGDGATFAATEHAPFAEPLELRAREGELEGTLTVGQGPLDIAGAEVLGKSYNGSFPGPTMVVSPGDWIRLRLVNNLAEPTNVHFHGFHTSPSGIADNVLRTIPAKTTARVAVPVPDDMEPGVYWYHSHQHGISESQVFSGLSGSIVVEGIGGLLPPDYEGIEERLFSLKDLQVKDGAIVTENIDSGAPTTRTVNGLVDPEVEIAPGETQLWRFANISADIWYRAYFGGRPFHVIGEDANPVGRVWRTKELLLPPGKRFDVLVEGPPEGTHELKTLPYSTGPAGDDYPERTLATVISAGARAESMAIPTSLGELPDISADEVDRRRLFVFSERDGGNEFYINGKQFNHHRIDVEARLGETEEWVIKNVSDEQHPFHIHINDFQVISVDGRPYKARSLQDTQPLPVHGKVVIRQTFTQFTGEFVYHCHILAHEDNGMMGLIRVSAR